MVPCRNVAVSAIFADALTFNFHTSGRGMTSMIAPVTTFGIAMYRVQAISSIHVPPLIDLSHANDRGEHRKNATTVLATPVVTMRNPTRYAVMVKDFLLVVKTRMYSKRMAHFDNAIEAP